MEPVKTCGPAMESRSLDEENIALVAEPIVEELFSINEDDVDEDDNDMAADEDIYAPAGDDDDWDGYEPSISDRLQVGYYRMDRACQTNESDLVNLKQLADLLAVVTMDITTLRKSLYYAKLTLQAEYDGRLQDELTSLNKRINGKLVEIESIHEEKINVLRRSYRTQLANALCKLSRDYHRFYCKKDADAKASHMEKLNDLENEKLECRKNELRQKELAELLRLQAEEANAVADEESSTRESTFSASKYTMEIEELNTTISELEMKIDYLEDMLDETNTDNSRLNSEVDQLATRLNTEERKTKDLQEEISVLNKKLVKERYAAQERLNQQKEKLKAEMDNKVNATRQKMQEDSAKQVADMKKNEAEKLRHRKLSEEMKIKELTDKQDEVAPVQPVVHHDTAVLLQQQESQKEELSNLQKECQRKTKLWEMKIKILQEHIHVLKDEMFLRSSLQRQSANMKQAALTYVRKGSQDVPMGVNPVDERSIQRKHRLPTIIQAPKNESRDPSGETMVNTETMGYYCKCK